MSEEKLPTIGVHSGAFHLDDAFAVFMLRQLPRFANARVVRTRDSAVLAELDCVADVGGLYDPKTSRFDHHQRGFNETFGHGFKTKLSAAGLVYKHHGREVLRKWTKELSEEAFEAVYLRVYKTFVESVDAVDNGVDKYEAAKTEPARWHDGTSLASRVSRMNPAWNEKCTDEQILLKFEEASVLAGKEFQDAVNSAINVFLPSFAIVKRAVDARFDVHPSGQIVFFPEYTAWKSALFDIEEQGHFAKPLLYTIYEAQNGSYRIQAVAKFPGSFVCRKPLPEAWGGLRGEELSTVSGVEGGVFVHPGRFIGGNETLEGAKAMADKALKAPQ